MGYLGDLIHAAVEEDMERVHAANHQADLEALADYEAMRGNGQHNLHVEDNPEDWEIPMVDKLSQTEWLG